MRELAERVLRVCAEIARCTEEPGRITRRFLSPPMHDVHRILGGWMAELGAEPRVDAAGNLRGIFGDPDAPRLLMGSHLDTVPAAGAYDGVLGVVLAMALMEARPGAAVEVIGFSEEEGVRFGMPFIGSRAVVGRLDAPPQVLQAIRDFGLDPARLPYAVLGREVTGYLEFHIEQGPALDQLALPLAVVNSIAGQSRFLLTFEGRAAHAGTTPMPMRQDALAAAAEWIAEVERIAGAESGLVATVGRVEVLPNAVNVIPGRVEASLDVRHGCDKTRRESIAKLLAAAGSVCRRRGVDLIKEQRLNQDAVPMDPAMTDRLAAAVSAAGYPVRRMDSGAGHDAMILAPHVPATMLFLRSPGGISHHPDESVLVDDVEAALRTGVEFLRHV